ncbi:hypothetical protein ILYODFUR_028297 [Ilyodon furcidens]|uniref:Uncharacterized protein n=1 Tax=Ilyodon furcidens TaxID=33524 RepID=A0ABV0TR56_9TELE
MTEKPITFIVLVLPAANEIQDQIICEHRLSYRHITPPGECFYHHLKIEVFNETSRENLTYGSINNSDHNKKIPCPQQIEDICTTFNGNFTWFKGANLLPGHHEAKLLVENAQKDDEDIYTCICTWTHNHKLYNSSGSRKLFVKEKAIYRNVEITSPTSKEQLVDKGKKTS